MKLKRALTVSDLLKMKHDVYEFEGTWHDAFDYPEKSGVWFIWGNSGNGKSTFALQLAKYMTSFGKVLYNSLEEGQSLTLKRAFERVNMHEVEGDLHLVSEGMEELDKRLSRQRSASIVFVDSVQYTNLNFKRYYDFKNKHKNKLIIFVSHATGREPSTKVSQRIMYDADLKIWVEGYKAISKGRYIGFVGEKVIWEEGARRYWGD